MDSASTFYGSTLGSIPAVFRIMTYKVRIHSSDLADPDPPLFGSDLQKKDANKK